MGLLGVAWSNILVGVAAALLIGAGTWAKDEAYNKYIERKYPVAGDYLTKFEDEEDGTEIVATAPANLKQNGREIDGRTIMPNDDREWILEGEISTSGYLNGVYYATDPHDRGVGNFFLYINYDRNMEGLWSGYDEVNQQISSGRYTFTPLFDAYTIRPLTADLIPSVIDIADQKLGKNYLETDLLEYSTDSESSYFTQVATVDSSFKSDESIAERLAERVLDNGPVVSEDDVGFHLKFDSRVVGFCLGAVFSIPELLDYLHIGENELPKAIAHSERIGLVRTIAVQDEFESQGIGTKLVGDCIDECLSRDATALCAVGWKEDGRVNIGGIMNHFGFQKAAEYEEYWYDESVEKGYWCERCGDPPCTCSGVLFTRYR